MKNLVIALVAFASLTGSVFAKNLFVGQYVVTHTESNVRYYLSIDSSGKLKFDVGDLRCWGSSQFIDDILVATMKCPGTKSFKYEADFRKVKSTDKFVAPVYSEAFGNSSRASFVRSLFLDGE